MIPKADLEDIFRDHASVCTLQSDAEPDPREVTMVCTALASGTAFGRGGVLSFLDSTRMPKNADWGYGLLWAEDAPPGMTPETRMGVTDSTGQRWQLEQAKPVYELDMETRLKTLIAWRLALRGLQRMVRGK